MEFGTCRGKGRRDVKGFLGTQAGFGADLNLLIQIAMGIALIVGAFLARSKSYSAHGACQATVLVLNLVLVSSVDRLAPQICRAPRTGPSAALSPRRPITIS